MGLRATENGLHKAAPYAPGLALQACILKCTRRGKLKIEMHGDATKKTGG